ncbi:MAG: carbohydrate porin, partial [Planctomycetes bacterium]|nr:carbohydrate porin [Planctomycetota bacterium]
MIRMTTSVAGWMLCLSLLSFGTAWGQEDVEWQESDVAEWLEPFEQEGETHFGTADAPVETDRPMESPDSESLPKPPGDDKAGETPVMTQPPQSVKKGIWERDRFLGEVLGGRTILRKRGIRYRGRVTQFFFGIQGGVEPPVNPALASAPGFGSLGIQGGNQFEYTGNSRHDFLVDLDQFGGLPHSKFVVTLENLWGRFGNVSFDSGGSTPAVFNAVMPVDPSASGTLYVTNFMVAQPLSKQFVVTVGKTRLVGVADNNIFAGGDGSDQFVNQTFCMNPLFVPQLPFSTFAVGAVALPEWGSAALTVVDPSDRTFEFMDLGSLYNKGVMLFPQVKVKTRFFDLPGQQHFGGFYKHVELLDIRFVPLPPSYPLPPDPSGAPQFQTHHNSYAIIYGFDQYVTTYGPANARGHTPGWGVFGRGGIADGATGNPAFSAWHASAGIGGESPIRTRQDKGDRFGLGYGYTATAKDWGPIPRALFGPRDAQVVEAYYAYMLTPAIVVTPDVQWVQGNLGGLSH